MRCIFNVCILSYTINGIIIYLYNIGIIIMGDDNTSDKKEVNNSVSGTSLILIILFFIITLIWIIAGIGAFIAGIVCLFYRASIQDKIIGLIFGIIAGPFYWIYYIYNINYCNSNIILNNNNGYNYNYQ